MLRCRVSVFNSPLKALRYLYCGVCGRVNRNGRATRSVRKGSFLESASKILHLKYCIGYS